MRASTRKTAENSENQLLPPLFFRERRRLKPRTSAENERLLADNFMEKQRKQLDARG